MIRTSLRLINIDPHSAKNIHVPDGNVPNIATAIQLASAFSIC
jgi:hypothetical protein